MRTFAARYLVIASLIASPSVMSGACGSSGGGTTGTGGKPVNGTGGSSTGTGGKTGTGGSSTGSGGSSTGSGGTGSGGSGPTDAGSPPTIAYTFDTTTQGFSLNNFVPAAGTTNLAAPDSGSAPVMAWDGTAGNPSPGSLKVTATFTGYRQLVDAIVAPMPPLNLTGKTLHAKVRLVSGNFTGGAILHVGTTSAFAYGAGAYTTLADGTWKDLTFNLSNSTAAGWDPSMVVQIGIQFYSGDPPEAGSFPGPIDAVFQIDSITDGTLPTTPTDGGATPAHPYTFDTSTQTFAYNTFVPGVGTTNLAAPGSGSTPTLVLDGTDGNPSPGSLKASTTFTDYQQLVDVIIGFTPVLNEMGKTLHAKVRLTSGTFGGGATLHASTTSGYVYGGGTYTPLTFGAWTDLTLDLSAVTTAMWDPTMVIQIGIQFFTGNRPEAGTFAGPNAVIFNIDTITD